MINLHLLLYIKGMLSKNQRNLQNKALKIRQLNNFEISEDKKYCSRKISYISARNVRISQNVPLKGQSSMERKVQRWGKPMEIWRIWKPARYWNMLNLTLDLFWFWRCNYKVYMPTYFWYNIYINTMYASNRFRRIRISCLWYYIPFLSIPLYTHSWSELSEPFLMNKLYIDRAGKKVHFN